MKLSFIKQPGGILHPASDIEAEKLTKFKTGAMYEVEIKNSRNAVFPQKMFVFLNFCFEHWRGGNEYQDEAAQFDKFRGDMTIMAGYYHSLVNIHGEARLVPKSLSYASMSQEQFEQLYSALINVALKKIFVDADQATEDKLFSFF
jgi:hypothetical protein